MRCPLAVVIGSCTVVNASVARVGLWLSSLDADQASLAEKPISPSAGRLVNRFQSGDLRRR
jgi:hypothetical protein